MLKRKIFILNFLFLCRLRFANLHHCVLLAVPIYYMLAPLSVLAQDPLLSIESTVPFYLNPANTGNPYYTQVGINYRNHLPAAGNDYVTYATSVDTYVERINSGFGLLLMADQLGGKTFTYNAAQLAYSYQISISENSIVRAGLMTNIYFASRNPNNLIFMDMLAPNGTEHPNTILYDKSSAFGADFGTGFLFESKSLKVGSAVHHLGSSTSGIASWNKRIKINAQVEWRIPLSKNPSYVPLNELKKLLKKTEIRPTALFIHQGNYNILSLGGTLQITNFNIGLHNRHLFITRQLSIFSLQVGYISESLEINYRMDIGSLGKSYVGMAASSHEIGVNIKFPTSKKEDW